MSEYANSDETTRGLVAPEIRVEVLLPLNQAFYSPTPLRNLSYSNDCFSVFDMFLSVSKRKLRGKNVKLVYKLRPLVSCSMSGANA